jgi:hypothetical protein
VKANYYRQVEITVKAKHTQINKTYKKDLVAFEKKNPKIKVHYEKLMKEYEDALIPYRDKMGDYIQKLEKYNAEQAEKLVLELKSS